MKTINFELSKRLNDLGLLDNVETEYYYNDLGKLQIGGGDIPAVTLEEAIEFLKGYSKKINIKIETNDYINIWSIYGQETPIFRERNILEAIEQMLEFLLDNNLLGNK